MLPKAESSDHIAAWAGPAVPAPPRCLRPCPASSSPAGGRAWPPEWSRASCPSSPGPSTGSAPATSVIRCRTARRTALSGEWSRGGLAVLWEQHSSFLFFRCGGFSRIGVRGCRQAPGEEDAWCPLFVRDIVIETPTVERVPPASTVPKRCG
ncbi:hypothetical protein DUI87_17646 [Hirundo rustica rustica]|uniref:Uncharacterized protein n=1 Tax=Hirundo rustica rustica TaxID=333673 RepID=A0A3M0K1B0_HIRRU|nr:hypothetical protein DUI87_17646 [Hirundo rustica rustica]